MQTEHNKRLNELEVNQTAIDTQKETMTRLRAKVLSLKKSQRSTERLRPRQLTQLVESQATSKQ